MSDKDRGLEASKDEKVGFFERLRMGNIDDEGSEAYRRFGAGRGKAERTPVETMAATPVTRPTAPAPEMDAMEAANAREPIAVPAGPRAEQPKPGGRPNVNVQAAKPSAPAKSSPKMQEQTYRRASGDTGEREPAYTRRGGATAEDRASSPRVAPASNQNYSNEGRTSSGKAQSRKGTVEDIPRDTDMPTVKGERTSGSDLSRNVANTISALGPGKLAGIGAVGMEMRGAEAARKAAQAKRSANLAKEIKAGQAKTKFTSAPKATQKNPAKKTKKFDDSESNIEFKRGGKAYAAGGSVSAASKRADGIASRGKTRCKIR
jgi:hypothetical protein